MSARVLVSVDLLKRLEWQGSEGVPAYPVCPLCRRPRYNQEHTADCALAVAIREAKDMQCAEDETARRISLWLVERVSEVDDPDEHLEIVSTWSNLIAFGEWRKGGTK